MKSDDTPSETRRLSESQLRALARRRDVRDAPPAARRQRGAAEALPEHIGKYPIERFLGFGAMGEVYLGRHPLLHLPVAVKVLYEQGGHDQDSVRRFIREARVTLRLNHPNIVRLYDACREDGLSYLVMEYVDGGDVDARLKRAPGHRLPVSDALHIVAGVAAALDAAAAAYVVHRDIKPGNILLTAAGVPKLADLGIAKRYRSEPTDPEETITKSGVWIGSPKYMAPEVWAESPIDTRVDIYALGVTFFQMLAGRPPYDERNIKRLLRQHLYDPIPDVRSLAPEVPEAVARIINRMLQKLPDQRYATPAALLAALRQEAVEQQR